jgi:hypothetical protein
MPWTNPGVIDPSDYPGWEPNPTPPALFSTPLSFSSGGSVPNVGTLPTVGSGTNLNTGSSLSSIAPLVGAGTSLLGGLLAPKSPGVSGQVNAIEANAGKLNTSAQNALGPVLKYFTALAGGDPNALLQATAPERGRVIDQYDAARKAAQLAPRGGGQASSETKANTAEAGQLADITAAARTSGAQALASTGLSLEDQATQQMTAVLQPILQQESQDTASTASLFKGIGSLIGAALFA